MLSAQLLDIMIWSILFMGISSVFGGYLTSLQDRKSLILSGIFTLVSGIFLVPVLIKFYGVYGGAVSVLFSEMIVCISSILFVIKKWHSQNIYNRITIKINKLNFIKVLSISFVVSFIIGFLDNILSFNPILDLLSCVIFGVLLYLIVSYILGTLSRKDLMEIKGMIKR
jgi:Na+-driven multidrug efflux pump